MPIGHILVCHSVRPDKLFDSIPPSDDPWFVFLHGEDRGVEERAQAFMKQRKGTLLSYRINRGLALSWNDGIVLSRESGCDAVLLLNDDLFFYDNCYAAFVADARQMCERNPAMAVVSARGLESGDSPKAGQVLPQGFSCCYIPMKAFDRVGFFDENLFPAYYEDADFLRRCALLGLHADAPPSTFVEHERSKTVLSFSEDDKFRFYQRMQASERYYVRKWGGPAYGEVYTTPFGPDYALKITEQRRSAPYGPGQDREDKMSLA